MKLSVIIPVYNEESTIAEVIERVAAVDIEKEIIVVDDGSTDRTTEIVRGQAPQLRVIHENRANFGKGAAIRVGLTYATGELVIIQDADLELDPAEYVRLIAPILDGRSNVVSGSRFLQRNAIPRTTRLKNRLLTGLANILYGARLTDVATAYKVFRRSTLDGVRLTSLRFEIESEMTARFLLAGERIIEVPISYRPRNANEGKKLRWSDGLAAAWCLVRLRFVRR